MEKPGFPRVVEAGGVVLTLTPDEAYIEFESEAPSGSIDEFIKGHRLELVKEREGFLPGPQFNEAFAHRRWVRLPGETNISAFVDEILDDDRVRLVSPVYHRADLLPKKTGLTFADYLLVRFRQGASERDIMTVIKKLGTVDKTGKPNLLGDSMRRLLVRDAGRHNALEIAGHFEESRLVVQAGPDWVQLHPALSTTIPNDTYWPQQWSLARIGVTEGWDLSQGANSVVIAILDTGCDLNHEDLAAKYVPAANRLDTVDGTNTPDDDWGHGTCCAGIAAAESNDNQGVAGIAWNCRIMPIRMMQNAHITFESRMLDALNWAQTRGADVINMSWHWDGPQSNVDSAIASAHGVNIILIAAAGNDEPTLPPNTINYPAIHPLVMAVGASDQADQRCAWSIWEASQFGPELDVVAPGIATWSTDRSGLGAGYNDTGAAEGDAAGNYFNDFGGTSGAAAHVSGLAGLLRSLYPGLNSNEIRFIIENTAEKVGGYAYSPDAAYPGGSWNNEMGYGRINVFRALDFADMYIKDNPADDGGVPFAGNFYNDSDIVVRKMDDGIFAYEGAKQGQANFIYVRATSLGPNTARNASVSIRAVPFAGTEFVYPHDWTAVDATHVQPAGIVTNLGNLAPGAAAIAKFRLSSAQISQLYGWESGGWHPCLLAEVHCDNDYGTAVGVYTWLSNNLAQRNLSEIETNSNSWITYRFVSGHVLNEELYMELIIDRRRLPREVELLLDPWESPAFFPGLEGTPHTSMRGFTFLDRTRLAVALCGCEGILTLEAGSLFECRAPAAENVFLKGAEWVERQGKRLAAIRAGRAVIGVQKGAGEVRPMAVMFRVPDGAERDEQYWIDVSQRNTAQEIVGGVALVVKVR